MKVKDKRCYYVVANSTNNGMVFVIIDGTNGETRSVVQSSVSQLIPVPVGSLVSEVTALATHVYINGIEQTRKTTIGVDYVPGVSGSSYDVYSGLRCGDIIEFVEQG